MPAFSFALLRVSYRVCEWIWHCFTGSCSHWVLAAGVHYTVRIRSRGQQRINIRTNSFQLFLLLKLLLFYILLSSAQEPREHLDDTYSALPNLQQTELYSHSSEAATRKDVRRHIKRLGLSLNLVMFLCWTTLTTTQSHLSSKAELMGSILAILVNSKL